MKLDPEVRQLLAAGNSFCDPFRLASSARPGLSLVRRVLILRLYFLTLPLVRLFRARSKQLLYSYTGRLRDRENLLPCFRQVTLLGSSSQCLANRDGVDECRLVLTSWPCINQERAMLKQVLF